MEIVTQAEAKARGLKTYNDGTRCQRGHTGRYTNSRGCVECARMRQTRVKVPKPIKAAPVADAAPTVYEPEKSLHRDPGTRVSQARIDEFIERVFNDGARLQSEAA